MKTFLKGLFEYNVYCNQKLTAQMTEQLATIDAKSMALFSHMLNAHHIWNCRILGQPAEHGVWENRPANEWATTDQHNHEQTLAILDTLDLTTEVAYSTSSGQPFTNTIGDILFHVINHSTYHRGQIALLFRQNGMEPLVTDYIFYKR